MDEYRVGLGLGQDVGPFRPIGLAPEHASEIALVTAVITADAGEYIRLGHGTVLPG